MLITIFTDNVEFAYKETDNIKSSISKKRSNTIFEHIDQDNFDIYKIKELATKVGLFGQKAVIIIKNLTSTQLKEIKNNIDSLSESGNLFVVVINEYNYEYESDFIKKSIQYKKIKKTKKQVNIFDVLGSVFFSKGDFFINVENIDEKFPNIIEGALFWFVKNKTQQNDLVKLSTDFYKIKHSGINFENYLFQLFLQNVNK